VAHQFLGSVEIEKILMISEDDNGVGIYFQIVVPFCKSVNYSKQFTIKDLIITFCRVQGLGKIATGVVLAVSSVWRSTAPVATREASVLRTGMGSNNRSSNENYRC
jgi:hypothetical protein